MLKRRAFNATLWSAGDILVRQGLQFLITIVLMRLLGPSDFGVVALLGLFVAVATSVADAGFSAAIIQSQHTNHTDESTVFWCNLAIGLLVSLVLILLAPVLASFYALPVIGPLMTLMALNVPISALGAVHLALLRKKLQFQPIMAIGAIAAIVSGAASITLATWHFGVWALAVQIVATNAVTTALLWVVNSWKPAWTFRLTSARKLFGFGAYYMAASLLEVVYTRLYAVILGKLSGPRDVGYYNNADSIVQLPVGFLTGVFGRVLFPMFSAAANDRVQTRRGMEFALRGMIFINSPLMLGLAALAEPFIRTVFGEQWVPAAEVLQLLCFASLLAPFQVMYTYVLLAHGHARRLFQIEAAKKTAGIVLTIAGSIYGITGLALSQVAYAAISYVLSAPVVAPLVGYPVTRQLHDALPALGIALGMAGGIYVAELLWPAAPHVKLLVLGPAGAIAFALAAWCMRIAALKDILTLFTRSSTTGPA